MRRTKMRRPLSRTIVFDNSVGISLKSALWRTEPSPAVWQRIKAQLEAKREKDVSRPSSLRLEAMH